MILAWKLKMAALDHDRRNEVEKKRVALREARAAGSVMSYKEQCVVNKIEYFKAHPERQQPDAKST